MAITNAGIAIANKRIVQWSTRTRNQLLQEILRQGIKHTIKSPSPTAAINSLKQSTRKDNFGIINRVGYNMPRHMIYVHKGVGRGTPIEKAGQTNRKAKPWFNPVINRRIDELADIVAEELGSDIINNLAIK